MAKTFISLSLPQLPHCVATDCKETRIKGRGLCHRHYVLEWTRGEHVFRPKAVQKPITQVRSFLYDTDLKVVDKLAKSAGLTRSEFIRDVMHSVVTAALEE